MVDLHVILKTCDWGGAQSSERLERLVDYSIATSLGARSSLVRGQILQMSVMEHNLWRAGLDSFFQRLLVTSPGSIAWPYDLFIPAEYMAFHGPITLPPGGYRSDTFGLCNTQPFYVGGICDNAALMRCFFSPALNRYIEESKVMGVNGKGLSIVRLEDAEWRVMRDPEMDWLREKLGIADRDSPLLIIYSFKVVAFRECHYLTLPSTFLDSRIYKRFTGSIRPLPIENVRPFGDRSDFAIQSPNPGGVVSMSPIAHLTTPFFCGRLIHKSPAYSFSPSHCLMKGESNEVHALKGPLSTHDLPIREPHKCPHLFFCATFADSSGEVQGFSYQIGVVDMLYDRLKVGKVYYVDAPSFVVPLHGQGWEFIPGMAVFEFAKKLTSEIEECLDPNVLLGMPEIQHRVIPLDQLDNLPTGFGYAIDVMGVLVKVSELDFDDDPTLSRLLSRRRITVVDSSHRLMTVVLKGWAAMLFNSSRGTVLVFRGVVPYLNQEKDPAELELEAFPTTMIWADPEEDDLPGLQVKELWEWWKREGAGVAI